MHKVSALFSGSVLFIWVVLAATVFGQSQVATTQVADTVYLANGAPAAGSVLVSWPAFTTQAGQAVPAGKLVVTIGSGGIVNIGLAPNAGAMPAGTYYTAVYHLSDGTVSTEYWSVPQAPQTTIAAIRSTIVPATVAVQSASIPYVNSAIASAVSGYLPLSGGTLSGPLYLAAAPVQATQAATKSYVDSSVGTIGSGIATKLDLNPSVTQSVQQPAGTTLGATSLQNVLYAGPNQTGAGNNGIVNSMALPECASGGCMVIADPGYSTVETPPGDASTGCYGEPGYGDVDFCGYLFPNSSKLLDQRGGVDISSYQNPLNRFSNLGGSTTLNTPAGFAENAGTAQTNVFDYDVDYGNGQLVAFENLQHQFAGGHNGNYGSGWGKTNTYVGINKAVNFSQGQHSILGGINFCLGLGDCMGSPTQIFYASGLSSPSDEGIHRGDSWIMEDSRVFQGTCVASSGCAPGSTQLELGAPFAGLGDQGEGRMAIDLSKASAGNCTGCSLIGGYGSGNQITGFSASSGNTPVVFNSTVGTFTASTGLGTIAAAITAATGQGQPGVQTVSIATSGGTAATFVPGVICVTDQEAFEMVMATSASSSSITASFRKPHLQGAVISQGGTCGWGLSLNADIVPSSVTTSSLVRVLIPLAGSVDTAHTWVAGQYNLQAGSAWTYAQTTPSSGVTATYNRTSGLVVVTGNFGFAFQGSGGNFGDVNGQTLTISGATSATGANDANYNGQYAITILSNSSFSYSPTSSPTSASLPAGTLTVTECNCSFTLYPRAEVLSVYSQATKQVNGSLQLEPNNVAWAVGDTVEVPHWHLPDVNDTHDYVRMYTPQAQIYGRGYSFSGIVSGDLHGFELKNMAPTAEYQGYGGWSNAPGTAIYVDGAWQIGFTVNHAPLQSLFTVGCKPDLPSGTSGSGCSLWNAAYSLFTLSANNGGSSLNFDPNAQNFSYKMSNSPCAPALGSSVGTVGSTSFGGIAVGGYASNCALFTPGLALNGSSTLLTGQSGTGSSIVTNAAPTISTATLSNTTLSGQTTVPSGQTLTVAGSINVTGTCTGCGSVTIPGTSGQFLTSNGSGGVGATLTSTGTGNVMLSNSPITGGTLTAASITSTGVLTQNGPVYINASSNSGPVSILTGTGGGSVNIGNATSILTVNGGASFGTNGSVSLAGQTSLAPTGTATASAPAYSSNALRAQSSLWSPNYNGTGNGAACQTTVYSQVNPTSNLAASTLTNAWIAPGRTACNGLTFSQIVDDESGFLDGVKVTHILSGGTAPTIAAGPGSGSGATVTLINATDLKGTVTVTTGTAPVASSAIVTVQFGTAYLASPVCTVTPASATAIGTFFAPPASGTSFNISSGATAPSASTTYTYSYTCME